MKPEHELLTILMEECGEVIQRASKIIRFGADKDNVEAFEKELGDLQCMIDLCQEYDLISFSQVDEFAEAKREKLKKYSSIFDS